MQQQTQIAGVTSHRIRGHIDRIARFADTGELRNFGFIRTEAGEDVFLHKRKIEPASAFKKGTLLEFETVPPSEGKQFPVAVKVKVLG